MKKIGMIIPSSNTVVEPMIMSMLTSINHLTVHFSRFKVTEISLDTEFSADFEVPPMLESAHLLADAEVDVIAYNGTSGGWLGVEKDLELCEAITTATGIPSTTSVLALIEVLQRCQATTFCIVTPSTDEITNRVINEMRRQGFQCTGSTNFGVQINKLCSTIKESQIEDAVRQAYVPGTDAIILFGTNMRGASLAAKLEQQYKVPVLDTITVTLWKCMELSDKSVRELDEWGVWLARIEV